MYRDGNAYYINENIIKRQSKSYDDNYERQVKRELNKVRDKIIIMTGFVKNNVLTPAQEKERAQLDKDYEFWKSEMNHFDNNPSHKKTKPKFKKLSAEALHNKTLEYIEDMKKDGTNYISRENVAKRLQVRPKDLDKTFMQLNREGILGQAQHKLMHDSRRGSGPLLSNDYSDWATDFYQIYDKTKETDDLER